MSVADTHYILPQQKACEDMPLIKKEGTGMLCNIVAGCRSKHLDAVEEWYDEGAGAKRLTSTSLHIHPYYRHIAWLHTTQESSLAQTSKADL